MATKDLEISSMNEDIIGISSLTNNSDSSENMGWKGSSSDVFICGIHLSNKMILSVSAISFLLFVIAEFIGAFASNSLSLLGDAGAMSIDVLTVCLLSFLTSVSLSLYFLIFLLFLC